MGCCPGKQAVKPQPEPTDIVPGGAPAIASGGASNKVASVSSNRGVAAVASTQPAAVGLPSMPDSDWDTHYTSDPKAVAYAKQKGRPTLIRDGIEQIAYYHNRVTGESRWDSPSPGSGIKPAVPLETAQQEQPSNQAADDSAETAVAGVSPAGASSAIDSQPSSPLAEDGQAAAAAEIEAVAVVDTVAKPEVQSEYEVRQNQVNDAYIREQIERARQKDEEDAKDPSLLGVRVTFAGQIADGQLIKGAEETSFRFFVRKPAGRSHQETKKAGPSIAELMEEISESFGYSAEQLRMFYDGKLCSKSASVYTVIGHSYLDPVEGTTLATPVFKVYTLGEAEQKPEYVFKPVDHTVTPVQVFNTSGVNWMGQYVMLHNQLSAHSTPQMKAQYHAIEKSFDELQPQLQAERQMYELHTRFFEAAKVEAEAIVAECHRQLSDAAVPGAWYRYPVSNRKYTKNNIELQEVRDWYVLHDKKLDRIRDRRKDGTAADNAMIDAAGKMAKHELRGLQSARDLVDGLYAPLCAVIDVAGVLFLATAVYSGGASDQLTLVYGADEYGLEIHDARNDPGALERAQELATALNLRAHTVTSALTSAQVELVLPIGARIYRLEPMSSSVSMGGEPLYFIAGGLYLSPRAVNADGKNYQPWQKVRFETSRWFGSSQQLAEGWEYHTSTEPVVCSESGKVITDYEYWTYKSSGTKKKNYNVSVDEYNARVRTNNFNGVSRNDLVMKRVPPRLREEYWMHQGTGEKVTRRPIDRTPLNPDWLEFSDPSAKLEMSTLARYLEAESPDTEAEGLEDDGEEGGGAKEKELSVLDTLVEELKEIFEEDNYTTDDGREVPVEHVFEQELTPTTGQELVVEMHKRGLSLYHLGTVLSRLSVGDKYMHLRHMCLKEIISRSVKALVRAELRSGKPKTRKGPTDAAPGRGGVDKFTSPLYLRQVCHYYLNLVFQPADARTDASNTLWRKLKAYATRHFGFEVTYEDLGGMYKETVFHACCAQLRIRLAGVPALDRDGLVVRAEGRLDFTAPEPIALEDIAEVLPTSRCIEYRSATAAGLLSKGVALDAKGVPMQWPRDGGPEREQATALLRHAVQAACAVYGGESAQAMEARRLLAEQLKGRHAEKGRRELSRWNKCGQVPENDLSIEARGYLEINKQVYLKAARGELSSQARADADGVMIRPMSMELAQCCLSLAQLSKDPTNHSDNSNHIAHADRLKEGPPQCECARFLNEASVVTEALLGTNHPSSAQLYMHWAGAYQDLASFEDASTWLRHAFLVHEAMYGLRHPATVECWRMLKTVEVKVHDGLQDVPMEHLKEEIEKERDAHDDDSEYEEGTEYDSQDDSQDGEDESDEEVYH